MVNYRIKIVTALDGHKEFYTEEKGFFGYKKLEIMRGSMFGYYTNQFKTREEALACIDTHVAWLASTTVASIDFEYITK